MYSHHLFSGRQGSCCVIIVSKLEQTSSLKMLTSDEVLPSNLWASKASRSKPPMFYSCENQASGIIWQEFFQPWLLSNPRGQVSVWAKLHGTHHNHCVSHCLTSCTWMVFSSYKQSRSSRTRTKFFSHYLVSENFFLGGFIPYLSLALARPT